MYDFEYFQGLTFGLFEFEDPIVLLNFFMAIYFNDIENNW